MLGQQTIQELGVRVKAARILETLVDGDGCMVSIALIHSRRIHVYKVYLPTFTVKINRKYSMDSMGLMNGNSQHNCLSWFDRPY